MSALNESKNGGNMKTINTPAKQILQHCKIGWGKQKIYFVTTAEIIELIKAGAVIINSDEPINGPMEYTVKFKRQLFVSSGFQKIKINTINK